MNSLRLNRHSLKQNNSPPVSLETGGHRIRTSRLMVHIEPLEYSKELSSPQLDAPQRKLRMVSPERRNQDLILLLAILALCCVTSFASAYHLYASRWDIYSWAAATPQANGPMKALVLDVHDSAPLLPLDGAKYLSYLPHSGVHNQRIALENALTLARLLNRTLLVPPIRVGRRPVRYLPFDTLNHGLRLIGSEGLDHCGDIPPYISLPVECLDYFDSTTLKWDDLFDMSAIEQGQPIRRIATHSPFAYSEWLSLLPDGVAQLKDEKRYHYHFLDAGITPPQDKYEEAVSISQLAQAPEILLQLGTLFGTSRLLLSTEGLSVLTRVRQSMTLGHQVLQSVADAIEKRMPSNYIGLHLRVGDGRFSDRRDTIIQESWSRLLQRLGYTATDINTIAQLSGLNLASNTSGTEPSMHHYMENKELQLRRASRFSALRSPPYHRLSTPVFVSTDLKRPRSDPSLLLFHRTFPSLHFILDFQDAVKPLRSMRNADGVELYDYLLPFLEAMVVARGTAVVGTPGSTFSKFIEQNLWPAHHPNQEGKPWTA